MKRILVLKIIICTTFTMRSECEDCRKLRDEIKKAWDANLSLSKEMRALMDHNIKSLDTIRKYQN